VAGIWVIPVIPSMAAGLRLYSRYYFLKRWDWTDYFMIVAVILNLGLSGCLMTVLFYEQEFTPLEQSFLAASVVYVATLWAIKASIATFYFDLGRLTTFRRMIMGALVILGVTFITVVLLSAIMCNPPWIQWSVEYHVNCSTTQRESQTYVIAVLNVLTDLMLIVLPFPLLRTFPLRLQLALGALFSCGLLVVVVSIIRAVTIKPFFEGAGSTSIIFIALSVVETNLGLIVSNGPMIYGFVRSKTRRRNDSQALSGDEEHSPTYESRQLRSPSLSLQKLNENGATHHVTITGGVF